MENKKIIYYKQLDSTNTEIARLATEGAAHGTVVVADAQTAGKGRRGRQWESPAGENIYMSILLRPDCVPDRAPMLTLVMAYSVAKVVRELGFLDVQIKWPNDLALENRKLAGILTELVVSETGKIGIVIGIGINVSQMPGDFSQDVAEIATSLEMALKRPVSRDVLVTALMKELDNMYGALLRNELSAYLTAYRRSCVNLGKTVQLIRSDGSREIAVAMDVDDSFGLVVRTEAGTVKTVRDGEVSVRGLYGYLE